MAEARVELIWDPDIYSKIEYISTIPKQKLEWYLCFPFSAQIQPGTPTPVIK